jgi:hypothetical protein
MDNQVTISEQLVSEGNEQADREQRTAAGDAEVHSRFTDAVLAARERYAA